MEACPNCGGSGFAVGSIGYPCGYCEGTGEVEEEKAIE